MASGSSWTWDNASTWEPVTRAPLLVCAHADSAVTTKSGVVMVAGRFPGLALMVSWDDAMSWEFYLIDTSGFAANGALVELEPDGKCSRFLCLPRQPERSCCACSCDVHLRRFVLAGTLTQETYNPNI